jgi:hypothetical protein
MLSFQPRLVSDHSQWLEAGNSIVQSPSTDIWPSEVLHQNSGVTLSKLAIIRTFYSKILRLRSLIGALSLIQLIIIVPGSHSYKVI